MPIITPGKKYRARNGQIFTPAPYYIEPGAAASTTSCHIEGKNYMWQLSDGLCLMAPNSDNADDRKAHDLLEEVFEESFQLPESYIHEHALNILSGNFTADDLLEVFHWASTPNADDWESAYDKKRENSDYRLPFRLRHYVKKCVREYERRNPSTPPFERKVSDIEAELIRRTPMTDVIDDEIPF